jgi:Predicted nucleotide-binding protein containing TIR-like domain
VDYPDHAQNFRAYLAKSKEDAIALLRQAVRGLEEEIGDRGDLAAAPIDIAPTIISSAHNRKVFVVHGREEGPREAVARFLERLGFQPIILHEQANQGRTVIEKVEDNSDVGFAVIIVTPDDMGNLKEKSRSNAQAWMMRQVAAAITPGGDTNAATPIIACRLLIQRPIEAS